MEILPLDQQLKALPARPGVYIFKDARGAVLYVGKAGNLHNRTRSHFGPSGDLTAKEQRMQGRVVNVEFIVTDSEQQALILECTLIKKYHPRYNVLLKDDKSFPYLKIDLKEKWPRVQITRRFQKDGARYFGPFASAGSVRSTLKLLKRLFPFVSCKHEITGKETRACLEYHIHRCLAPCAGKTTTHEYGEVIRDVMLFLEGRQERVLRDLKRKMNEASAKLEFERAAWLRDQISAVEMVIEGQRLAAAVRGELDAIALARSGDQADVQVFFVRNSRLVGREHFAVEGVEDETPSQVMTAFVEQFYNSSPSIPPLILLQHPIGSAEFLGSWLKCQRNGSVQVLVPKRGARRQLIEVVAENACQALEMTKLQQLTTSQAIAAALTELKEQLSLPHLPSRMECYDISNIQGALAVGSMVVFQDGVPKPAHYRRFRIKSVEGANDFAMLQEVLGRRFTRSVNKDVAWVAKPDLVLIDGGKGQLNAALEVMKDLAPDVPVASLAKEREEVFLPDRSDPLALPASSPGRRMLQRIRDEAHRFALSYHQRLRSKKTTASLLDSVSGIGDKRRKDLIKKFGSVRGIRAASVEDLATVPGITPGLAARLKEQLQ